MKYNFIIVLLFTICFFTCVSKEVETNGYQTSRYSLDYEETIKGVQGVIHYKQYALFFTSRNKIFALNTETSFLQEYSCNLKKLDEFLTISDTVLMASGDELFYINSFTENDIIFEEYIYEGEDNEFDDFSSTYQVSEFSVSSCCIGEWGGSVYFEDTGSNIVYSTESTCLINVDTLDNEIYLFNYLPHLLTFTSIVKVGNVRTLPIIKKKDKCNWYYKYFNDNYENQDSVYAMLLGDGNVNTVVFDTIGMPILYGFTSNEGIKLIHPGEKSLLLLSLNDQGQLVVEEELVKLEGAQNMHTRVGRNGDFITISCSKGIKLSCIIDINRNNNLIKIFEFN